MMSVLKGVLRRPVSFQQFPRFMVFQLTKGTECFQFSCDQFEDLHNSKMSAYFKDSAQGERTQTGV